MDAGPEAGPDAGSDGLRLELAAASDVATASSSSLSKKSPENASVSDAGAITVPGSRGRGAVRGPDDTRSITGAAGEGGKARVDGEGTAGASDTDAEPLGGSRAEGKGAGADQTGAIAYAGEGVCAATETGAEADIEAEAEGEARGLR